MQVALATLFILAFLCIVSWIRKEYYEIQQQMDINCLLNEHEENQLLITEDVHSAAQPQAEQIKE